MFLSINYNKSEKKSQLERIKDFVESEKGSPLGYLQDFTARGREQPWRKKKLSSLELAECFDRLGLEKEAERLRKCGEWLMFRESGNKKKLHKARFCKNRLCTTCGWRRSRKTYGHVSRIMTGLESEKEYGYICVTLTVPSVYGPDLASKIDEMMMSWKKFLKLDEIKKIVRGWYRGFEVTHNVDEKDKSFDTFHPHLHCIFVVDKNYFKSKNYLNHDKWVGLWQEATGDYTITQVYVRKVYGNTAQAVAEIAKYTVKESDYILPNDFELMDKTVEVLRNALKGRRLVAYGGKMREWHKKLNLDDEMDGDLIHIGDEEETEMLGFELVTYLWGVGYTGRQDYWRT